jgi:hypothetical protein
MTKDNQVEIYQFYIWIKRISPMIWRRLLVRYDSTIADLHYYIQIAMGWEDIHLNQFMIRGVPYGVYHSCGMSFSDNPNRVYLRDFQFHINERFIYEYDFFAHWEHEIRLEKKLPINPKIKYPICIGGNHVAPPEDCGNIENFMEMEEHYKPQNLLFELMEKVEECESDECEREDLEEIIENWEDWQSRQFSLKAINNELQEYANNNGLVINI